MWRIIFIICILAVPAAATNLQHRHKQDGIATRDGCGSDSPDALWIDDRALVNFQYGYGDPYGGGGGSKSTTTNAPYAYGTATAAGGSTTATSAAGEAGDEDGEYYPVVSSKKAVIAHVVCGALVTMLFLPAGVVVPRIARGFTTSRWWFVVHAVVQGGIVVVLAIAGFSIAWAYFSYGLDTPHRKIAAGLFVLILFQAVLGVIVHWFKPGARIQRLTSTPHGRTPLNFIHMALGVAIMGVGWATSWTGLTIEWEYRGHGTPVHSYRIGWGVIVGLWSALWLAGLIVCLPRQLKLEAGPRRTSIDDDGNVRVTKVESPPTPPSIPSLGFDNHS